MAAAMTGLSRAILLLLHLFGGARVLAVFFLRRFEIPCDQYQSNQQSYRSIFLTSHSRSPLLVLHRTNVSRIRLRVRQLNARCATVDDDRLEQDAPMPGA